MPHQFITPEQLARLPREPEQAWSEVVSLTLTYLEMNINENTAFENDEVLRDDAVRFLGQLQHELDLPINKGVYAYRDMRNDEALTEFAKSAANVHYSGWAKQIGEFVKAGSDATAVPTSKIALSNGGVLKLHYLTAQLKSELLRIELEDRKRQKLLSRLQDFENEIGKKSVSISGVLTIIALIGAGVAGTTSTLADGPGAIETVQEITLLLGQELDNAEEVKMLTAEAKPLQLPPPVNEASEEEATP